jgi:hypothetical protein
MPVCIEDKNPDAMQRPKKPMRVPEILWREEVERLIQFAGSFAGDQQYRKRNGRYVPMIGIGAAVARRPLPNHRAYGSVHGGSRGYAIIRRPAKEDRAI